jgi:hypothetical protein
MRGAGRDGCGEGGFSLMVKGVISIPRVWNSGLVLFYCGLLKWCGEMVLAERKGKWKTYYAQEGNSYVHDRRPLLYLRL